MEENLPKDDNLENFVRKSFDQFEENPSSDIWSRIEGNLTQEVAPPPTRIKPIYFSWKAAAVAAIFLLSVGLIAQHLYFNYKIKQLAARLPDTTTTIPAKEQTSISPSTTIAIQPYKQTDNKPVTAREHLSAQSPTPLDGALPAKELSGNKGTSMVVSTESQKLINEIQNDRQQVTAENVAIGNEKALVSQETSENIAGTTTDVSSATTLRTTIPVFPRYAGEVAINNDVLPLKATPVIQPVRTRGWYLGAQSTIVQTRERKIKQEEPFDNKHIVANKQKEPLQTTQWWLKAGKTSRSGLGFETGIGYQHFQRNASHQPDFKLRDGRPSMGGGGGGPHHHDDHEFDFQYTLNSFSGTQNIELRVAQADSNAMYPDNEPLDLSVTTHEQVEVLKVPVLAVAAFGKGRTKAVVKGGLVGNFVLKNDFEITGIDNRNPHFIHLDDEHPMVQTQSPQKFSIDYLLSAGVEYRVTPSLSLVAEPTVSGELSFNDASLCARPKLWSAGLNMGVNYRF